MNVVERSQHATLYQKDAFDKVLVLGENLNYEKSPGNWVEANYDWQPSPMFSADYQMVDAFFKAYVLKTFGANQQVRFACGLDYVDFTPLPLYYRSQGGTSKVVAYPQGSQGTINGPEITWLNPYGENSELTWYLTTKGMTKLLTIHERSFFPSLASPFLTRASLEIPFRVNVPPDVEFNVLDVPWEDASEQVSEYVDVLTSDSDDLQLVRPYFYDANGMQYWGRYRVVKSGNAYVVSAFFNLNQVYNAAYPIVLDPTLTSTITTNANTVGVRDTRSGTTAVLQTGQMWLGTNTSGGGFNAQLSETFTAVTIPQGAGINSTTWTTFFASKNGTVDLNVRITLDDVTNSAAPTTTADFLGRSRTPISVVWNAFGTGAVVGDALTSPDIKSLIQWIVNKSGWASGNAITLFAQDNDTTNFSTTNRVIVRAEEQGASSRNYLTIDYVSAPSQATQPTNPVATASPTPTKVTFTWTASTNAVQYNIYRNGVYRATVGNVTSYVDSGVSVGSSYYYSVEGINTYQQVGTRSANSNTVVIDSTAPSQLISVRGR